LIVNEAEQTSLKAEAAPAAFPARKPRGRPRKAIKEPVIRAASEPEPPNEVVLAQLERSAGFCRKVQDQLAGFATPELEIILKLYRILILKLGTTAEAKPEHWEILKDLMRPVMDWARLEEQQKEREFTEQKYQDEKAAEEAEKAAEAKPERDRSLKDGTREKIELELHLL
jgi:hypothetical protein